MAQNLGNLFIDGESVIEDENGNHTITAHGDAAISTEKSKYGGGSLYLDTLNSYFSAPNNDDWKFTNNNFTVDFWVYFNPDSSDTQADLIFHGLYGRYYPDYHNWGVYVDSSGQMLFDYVDSGNVEKLITQSASLVVEQWYHLAVVRNGNNLLFFKNGVLLGSHTFTDTIRDSDYDFKIGTNSSAPATVHAYLDNIRLVNGTSLWTEDFELTDEALFYIDGETNPYVRPDNITGLYNLSSQGSLRGKAAEGFVRPTLQQFFAPYRMAFEEIISYIEKGYIFGGNGPLTDTDEYDPNTDTWTAKTSMAVGRYYLTATTISEKGYIFGGTTGGSSYVRDTDEFDNVNDTWTSKTDIPTPGRGAGSSCELSDKGYIFGGSTSGSNIADTEEYSPDTWTSKSNMPAAKWYSCSCNILDKGYVFAGWKVSGNNTQDCEEYNPDTWTSKTDMPSPARMGGAACTINSKGYIFGGNLVYGTQLKDVDEYFPDTWTSKTNMNTAAYYFAASTIGEKGYTYCGRGDGNVSLALCEEYFSDTWTSKETANPARIMHAATSI